MKSINSIYIFISDHYTAIISTLTFVGMMIIGFFQIPKKKKCPFCNKELVAIKSEYQKSNGLKIINSGEDIPTNKQVIYYKCPKCEFTHEEIF